MSEGRSQNKERLFHKDHPAYTVEDLHEYSMDILRLTGEEAHNARGEEYTVSHWGGDTTRFKCTAFAMTLRDSSTVYLYVQDSYASDSESACIYGIDGSIKLDGTPVQPRIGVRRDGQPAQSFSDEDSETIRGAIQEMLEESGVDGPTLTSEGRERYWEGVATVALDNHKGNSKLRKYAREVARGGEEKRSEEVELEIADIALSQTVQLESGEQIPAYASIPRRFLRRKIDSRVSEYTKHTQRNPQSS